MFKTLIACAAVVLLCLCHTARAEDLLGQVVAHSQVKGHDVPVYFISEVDAPVTEAGMDAFAIEVAYVLYAWTTEHHVEAIGNICKSDDGKRFGALLLTIGSHARSPRTEACPDGMVATGVNIHSHPQHATYVPNAIDRLFLVHPDVPRVGTEPDTYSGADYEQPGYMVGEHALHFQSGLGTERVIWNMSEPKPKAPPAP